MWSSGERLQSNAFFLSSPSWGYLRVHMEVPNALKQIWCWLIHRSRARPGADIPAELWWGLCSSSGAQTFVWSRAKAGNCSEGRWTSLLVVPKFSCSCEEWWEDIALWHDLLDDPEMQHFHCREEFSRKKKTSAKVKCKQWKGHLQRTSPWAYIY